MSVNSWNVPGSLAVANSLTVGGNPVQGQIQSDYSQTDNTKLDFVKNKPPVVFDGTTTTVSGPVSIPGQIVAATPSCNYSQISLRNTSTNATDSSQVAEINFDRSAAASSAKASIGCNPVRGGYWWVNGSDRINIDPASGNVTIGNSLVCPNTVLVKDLTVNNSLTANATVAINPPAGNGNYSCVAQGVAANPYIQLTSSGTSSSAQLANVSTAGNFLIGSAAGDAMLKSQSNNLLLGSNNLIGIRIDPSGNVYMPGKAYVQTQLIVSSASGSGQTSVSNSNTSTTDAGQVAETYYDRTAANSNSRAAVGMSGQSPRNFYIWVNGSDRLNIDLNGNVNIPGNLTTGGTISQGGYPTIWRYNQTAASATSGNNSNILIPPSIFTQITSDRLQTNTSYFNATGGGGTIPNGNNSWTMPSSGTWTINWTTRFANPSSENGIWIAVAYAALYGETSSNFNSNSTRLQYTSFTSYNASLSYTGYFLAGSVISLCAYSAVSNSMSTFGNANNVWFARVT